MSEITVDREKIKNDIDYCLRSFEREVGVVKKYKKLALKLSKRVRKNPAWSWRYVESVHHGTVAPGSKFILAIQFHMFPPPKPPLPEWLRKVKKNIAVMAKETRQMIQKEKT